MCGLAFGFRTAGCAKGDPVQDLRVSAFEVLSGLGFVG